MIGPVIVGSNDEMHGFGLPRKLLFAFGNCVFEGNVSDRVEAVSLNHFVRESGRQNRCQDFFLLLRLIVQQTGWHRRYASRMTSVSLTLARRELVLFLPLR